MTELATQENTSIIPVPKKLATEISDLPVGNWKVDESSIGRNSKGEIDFYTITLSPFDGYETPCDAKLEEQPPRKNINDSNWVKSTIAFRRDKGMKLLEYQETWLRKHDGDVNGIKETSMLDFY